MVTELREEATRVGKARQGAGGRWMILTALLGILTLLAAATAFETWANQFPPIPPARSSLPARNGYPELAQSLSAIGAVSSDAPGSDPTHPIERLDGDAAFLQSYGPRTLDRPLTPYRPALARLRSAIRLPSVRIPPGEDPWIRRLALPAARLFCAEGRLAAARDQYERAVTCHLDAVELGTRIGPGQSMREYLCGQECLREGVGCASGVVSHLTEAQARAAGDRLDRIRAGAASYSEALGDERAQALIETQLLLTNGEYAARLQAAPRPSGWAAMLQDWQRRLHPRRNTYLEVSRYFDASIERGKQPFPQVLRLPLPSRPQGPYFPPMIGDHALDFAHTEWYLRLLRLELALQEHFRRTGKHLSSKELDKLGLPAEVLTNPMDGDPLVPPSAAR